MKKILLAASAVVAMSFAAPAFGAACSTFTGDLLSAIPASACTVDGGLINVVFAAPTGSQSTASISLGAVVDAGNFLGFTFTPNGGTTVAYTVGYTATVASGATIFSSVNDTASALPGTAGDYNYSAGAGTSGTVAANFVYNPGNVFGLTAVTNTGAFTANTSGNAGTNQGITLDLGYTILSATPEPTSLILFGSGFLAIGLAARKRRKA